MGDPDRFLGIIKNLRLMENPENREGMSRFGINTSSALGVPMPLLRGMAKQIGRDHLLAARLWESGIHEARILACLIDVPESVTEEQMDTWVRDFNSWDLCDQCCSNLFDKTLFAWEKAVSWSGNNEEYVRRAGFVLMAALAVHDKKAPDERFLSFFPLIIRESGDERNFVKKAVNWALRQIGKRSPLLNTRAIETARVLLKSDNPASRWIGRDALKELTSEPVQKKLRRIGGS
jgi:3-methyladenine DNA glycosylase AlkD